MFDICHQAVEYESIRESLLQLVDAGIPIFKLQEAAALHVPTVTEEAVEMLTPYADTIYLTQTLERDDDGSITRFLNLDEALADWSRSPRPCEWRVHIHVPVFLDDLGAFRTTRFAIEDALRAPQGEPAVASARDRDLHLGHAPGRSQDRGHRRVRLPRARVGPRRAHGVSPARLSPGRPLAPARER